MTNALILGMLGLLMNGNAAEHPWWFWVTWWVAIAFNTWGSEKWR